MADNIEVTITWNPSIAEIVDDAVISGLNLAGAHLQGKMRDNFGRAAVGYQLNNVIGKMGRRIKTKDGSWKRLKSGAYAIGKRDRNKYASSAPGDFPGVRTGRLRNSIAMIRARRGAMVVTVGTNVKYGRYLEYGWMVKGHAQPARPWCRRTFNEERAKMLAILQAEAGKQITKKLGGK